MENLVVLRFEEYSMTSEQMFHCLKSIRNHLETDGGKTKVIALPQSNVEIEIIKAK